jgi:hypothetical protein
MVGSPTSVQAKQAIVKLQNSRDAWSHGFAK